VLKRIATSQLRVGMYVQELSGSWISHPFWRKSMALGSEQDLRRIIDAGIKACVIDTDKGLDVLDAVVAAPPPPSPPPPAAPLRPSPVGTDPVPLRQEMARARRVCEQGKERVISLFAEARMGKAIDAEGCLPLVDEIASSVMRNPGALISLARLKTQDEYTYMHSVAVCALMVALARQLNLPEDDCREAGLAGLLHDLGKSFVPMDIINKPGRLTEDEFNIVKAHPALGHKALLDGNGVGPVVLDVCLHHHEKMDGTGYPKGLKSDQISLMARMGAVCDVYDAITSNRPYKAGWDPAESVKKMAEWTKGHFDEKVFQAFVRSIGIYPTGSVVRLASGRLGVVMEQTEKSLLSPRVKVFFSTQSGMRMSPEEIDLSAPNCQDRIVAREDPKKWGLGNVDALWLGDQARI